MEIYYKGKKLDHTKEFEMVRRSKFGYNIEVHWQMDLQIYNSSTDVSTTIRWNCNEFHNLWEPDRVAFESDYHSTGWAPWNLKHFKRIIIWDAKEFHKSHATYNRIKNKITNYE